MDLIERAAKRLMQMRWLQRGLMPLGRGDLAPERWIFVVGAYNGGTSLLADLLADHPDIAGMPLEGVALTDSLPAPEAFGWTRLWCQCPAAMRLEPGPHQAARVDRIRRQWSVWLPRRPANVVEKSVPNAARLPFLEAHFAPAYFIYIVRNGYACAEGMRRKAEPARYGNRSYPDGYPIDLCARQWAATHRQVSADRPNLARFLTVRYEDLTAAPEATLAEITAFLGVGPLPAEALQRQRRIHRLASPVQNMNAASLARLSPADTAAIEAEAGEVLAELGYGPNPA